MPLDMPESILVRFKGKMQPGITLRDLVHAIPYYAIQAGLLTVEKKGKKTPSPAASWKSKAWKLTVEQAFELSDASAERSAAGCTIKLSKESITEYLQSNITLLRWMIGEGYGDARTLERRAQAMEAWLANPSCWKPMPTPNTPKSSRSTWPTSTSLCSARRTTRTTPVCCPALLARRSTKCSSVRA
jgi:aconitate hydratase 2/2-methylisocitrate dehydratase